MAGRPRCATSALLGKLLKATNNTNSMSSTESFVSLGSRLTIAGTVLGETLVRPFAFFPTPSANVRQQKAAQRITLDGPKMRRERLAQNRANHFFDQQGLWVDLIQIALIIIITVIIVQIILRPQ